MTWVNESVQRLVLVDDDRAEERILSAFLRSADANVNLLAFHSGEEFLEYMGRLRDGPDGLPNLVLLDIRMPELDGLEVLSRLRSMNEFRTSPTVVMFSNSRDRFHANKAGELGAKYQTKPSSRDEYLRFIESLGLARSGVDRRPTHG